MSPCAPAAPASFSYVRIPVDSHEAIEELTHKQVSLENDEFVQALKRHFSKGCSVSDMDKELLLKQMAQHAKVGAEEIRNKVDSLGEGAWEQLMAGTSVDIFSLALPIAANGFYGVSLYCDDKGISKGLKRNPRAEGLATACGFPAQLFHGDIFLSKVYDDGEDVWFRDDLKVSDCSSDAQWVQRAKATNGRGGAGPASLSNLAAQMGSSDMMKRDFVDTSKGNPVLPQALPEPELDCGKYKWTQNDEDVEILFSATGLTKKDVKVQMKRQRLSVSIRGELALDGSLEHPIEVDDSTWTLSGGSLQVILNKSGKSKWSAVVKA